MDYGLWTAICMLVAMHVIETVHAEPHDLVNSPCYHGNFWVRPHPGNPWALDAYVLTGFRDVTEVFQRVDEHGNGRLLKVFAETDYEPEASFQTPRKTGRIRLFGSNPNAGETVEVGRFEKI